MTILNFKYWPLRRWEMSRLRPPVAISPRIICRRRIISFSPFILCSLLLMRRCQIVDISGSFLSAPPSGFIIIFSCCCCCRCWQSERRKSGPTSSTKREKRKDAQELNRLLKALGRINKHTRSLLFLFFPFSSALSAQKHQTSTFPSKQLLASVMDDLNAVFVLYVYSSFIYIFCASAESVMLLRSCTQLALSPGREIVHFFLPSARTWFPSVVVHFLGPELGQDVFDGQYRTWISTSTR
jgi:hypothetical protein